MQRVITCAAFLVLSLTAVAQAEVEVEQVGGDLFVLGENSGRSKDDGVEIYQDYYYYDTVWIFDYDTGTWTAYYGVDKVWVDTGNGDDYVSVYNYYGGYYYGDGADVCVNTGNGNDVVDNYWVGNANSVEINTGNEDDVVNSDSYYNYYGGMITINTENGDDTCDIYSYYDYDLNINLGNGKDTVTGDVYYSFGIVDGGNGKDSCSGLNDYYSTLTIVNCEN